MERIKIKSLNDNIKKIIDDHKKLKNKPIKRKFDSFSDGEEEHNLYIKKKIMFPKCEKKKKKGLIK